MCVIEKENYQTYLQLFLLIYLKSHTQINIIMFLNNFVYFNKNIIKFLPSLSLYLILRAIFMSFGYNFRVSRSFIATFVALIRSGDKNLYKLQNVPRIFDLHTVQVLFSRSSLPLLPSPSLNRPVTIHYIFLGRL